MKTSILLVDDHAVLRKGVCLMLKEEKDIKIVDTVLGVKLNMVYSKWDRSVFYF